MAGPLFAFIGSARAFTLKSAAEVERSSIHTDGIAASDPVGL